METLKLIGSGYKVLLVKDDVIKYVEPGGLFSSKKNERLFSVYDFESVEVKKIDPRKGHIQLRAIGHDPSTGSILLTFVGEENYQIALSMQRHMQNIMTKEETSVKSNMAEENNSLFIELKNLYPQDPYTSDDYSEVISQIDAFISVAQNINPVEFDDMLKRDPLYTSSALFGPEHEVFGHVSSLLDILRNLDQVRESVSRKLQSCNEYEEYLSSIPRFPFELSANEQFQRLKLSNMGEIKISSVGKRFNRDALISFVVIDVETTGLRAATDDIVELSAIKFVEYEATEAFTTLVKPEHGIKEAALTVNHITQEMVENAPTIGKVMPAFIDFCEAYPLVGHNIVFDLKFLYVNGFPLQKKTKYFDTLELSKKTIQNIDNYKLDTICRYCGIYRNSSHRALSDCLATGILFDVIIKNITQ